MIVIVDPLPLQALVGKKLVIVGAVQVLVVVPSISAFSKYSLSVLVRNAKAYHLMVKVPPFGTVTLSGYEVVVLPQLPSSTTLSFILSVPTKRVLVANPSSE